MKILSFVSPDAGVGKTTLIFNVGWILAEAGLRVVLCDLDPQAGLTDRARGAQDGPGSVWSALSPLVEGRDEPGYTHPMALTPTLSLVCGHLELSVLDDELARTNDGDRARAVLDGIERFIRGMADEHDADMVLCDLGSNLGPFNRTIIEVSDGAIVPLEPTRIGATMRSLDATLRGWRSRSREQPVELLGFVMVGVPSATRDRLLADMDLLGTVERYPGLDSIERAAHKPAVALTTADGVMGAHLYAVRDLRTQIEALATAIVRASLLDSGPFTDALVETMEHELWDALVNEIPAELDTLSSKTTVELVEDIALDEVDVHRGGLRVAGSASVSVHLEWGGGERRDGVESSSSFPLRFSVDLSPSREITTVHQLEVDTSSFYE